MKVYYGVEGQECSVEQMAKSVGPGWFDIIERLVKDLYSLGWDGNVFQVKEKFGGLRFYIGNHTREMEDRIEEAEEESYHTCEECGNEGTLHSGGWMKVLCDTCAWRDA